MNILVAFELHNKCTNPGSVVQVSATKTIFTKKGFEQVSS